jgi:phage gp37-like protein
VTPTVEVDTYTAQITPSWTSSPETVTLDRITTVTPSVFSETYTTVETHNGHRDHVTLTTLVTETPTVEVSTATIYSEVDGHESPVTIIST